MSTGKTTRYPVQMAYHHGNLRAEALRRVDAVVRRHGPEAVSLRSLGAEAGVSHAAFRHHFGSRAGLLSAFAAEGYALLTDRLLASAEAGFLDMGVAYVGMAVQHPGHYQVMFSPDLLDEHDEDLAHARRRCLEVLQDGVRQVTDQDRSDMAAAILAGWAMMHGLASLHHSGVLYQGELVELIGDAEPQALARRLGAMLYGSPTARNQAVG